MVVGPMGQKPVHLVRLQAKGRQGGWQAAGCIVDVFHPEVLPDCFKFHVCTYSENILMRLHEMHNQYLFYS